MVYYQCGGVAEWLNAAALKSARSYSRLIQINNLQYKVLHRFGVFWAGLAAKMCNSKNSVQQDFCGISPEESAAVFKTGDLRGVEN